jgi:hypothetical protein
MYDVSDIQEGRAAPVAPVYRPILWLSAVVVLAALCMYLTPLTVLWKAGVAVFFTALFFVVQFVNAKVDEQWFTAMNGFRNRGIYVGSGTAEEFARDERPSFVDRLLT